MDSAGIFVDGNDVMAVYEAAGEAIKRAKRGEGPTLIECKTYRWRGHYEGDPVVYRTREEEEEWKKKDPILRFKNRLLEIGTLTEDEVSQRFGLGQGQILLLHFDDDGSQITDSSANKFSSQNLKIADFISI